MINETELLRRLRTLRDETDPSDPRHSAFQDAIETVEDETKRQRNQRELQFFADEVIGKLTKPAGTLGGWVDDETSD